MSSQDTGYIIAGAALLLLTVIPAVAVFVCVLCLARRRNDPARSWLALYKVAFGLFVLALILVFFSFVLAIADQQLRPATSRSRQASLVYSIRQGQLETGIIGALANELAIILTPLVLLGLAQAISLVHGKRESESGRMLRLGAYGVAAFLAVLDLVVFGLDQRLFTMAYGMDDSSRNINEADMGVTETTWPLVRASRVITFAMFVIRLIFAAAVLVWSIIVTVQTKSEPKVTRATRYLLICCTLLLLRASYDVGYWAEYVPLRNRRHRRHRHPQPAPYFVIVDIILEFWSVFGLFILLFALGAQKQQGVWATEQPFMMIRPGGQEMPQQTSRGNGSSRQSQQPLHPAWPQHEAHGEYSHHQQLPPEISAHSTPSGRPNFSPQQSWQDSASPYYQQPYEMGVQTSSPPPPPPAHSEAMGLYHQADGIPPRTSPLPYGEGKSGM